MALQQPFELSRTIIQWWKHNSPTMTATICCSIFLLNCLAKLAYFSHWSGWWQLTCSWMTLSSPITIPTNSSTYHVLDVLLISQAWMCFSGVISAICSVQCWVFCSLISPQISHASSVFDSQRAWTSSSACQCSFTLKHDGLVLIRFSSPLCFGFYIRCSTPVLNISQSICFLSLDVVKLIVCRALYAGIRTFPIITSAGHGNLEY